jgi:hypothetical protein
MFVAIVCVAPAARNTSREKKSVSKDHEMRGTSEARRHKFDHQIREQWLDRDAGLHAKWHASGLTRDEFIRRNEELIDKTIADNLDR